MSGNLCDSPAGLAPDGVTPNFNTSDTVLAVIAICFTVGRVLARLKKLQFSDYLVYAALILLLNHTGLMFAQTRYARHQWDVRACWYDGTYTKLLFAQLMLLNVGLFCSKTSILLLYYQIFEFQTTMRVAIMGGIVSCGLVYWTSIPLIAVLDAPHVGETWESVLITGRPEKTLVWAVLQAALSTCLDLYIFVLPIRSIMRLQLSPLKKLQILAVFTTGLVAVVASVLSLVYRVEAINTNDGTWKYTALNICNVVENNIAIIISNVPGMLTFFKVYVSQLGFIKSIRRLLNRPGTISVGVRQDPNRPRSKGPVRNRRQDVDLFHDTSPRSHTSMRVDPTFAMPQGTNDPAQQRAMSSLEAQTTNDAAAQRPHGDFNNMHGSEGEIAQNISVA